jgi:single-strand DNA-binding protein
MLNKCAFIGHLGKDPEIRTMTSGDRVANLSIGVTEKWRDKSSGEKKERTEWVRVVCFNENIVKVCENYLKKGSLIYVEGALQTRKYEQGGVEKYASEIVLQKFNGVLTMLGEKSEGQKSPSEDDYSSGFSGPAGRASPKESYDLNDDIPY